jgi:hypothetical protein
MTDEYTKAIEAAINSLRSKQPKTLGKKAQLVQFVDQLRDLLAAGWSRAELVAEIKANGGSVSPALLRDVLQLPPAKSQKRTGKKPMKDEAPISLWADEVSTAQVINGDVQSPTYAE